MKKLIILAVLLWAIILISNWAPVNAGVFDPVDDVYTWQWQEYGPRIDQIGFKAFNTWEEVLAAMQSDQIQVWDYSYYQGTDTLVAENYSALLSPRCQFSHLGFNMRKWPFMPDTTGNALRHAIAHLVPKDEIVGTIYHSYWWGNYSVRLDSYIPPGLQQWHNPCVDGHPYSIDEAVSILSASGFTFVDNPPIQGLPSSTVSAGPEDFWDDRAGTPLPSLEYYSPLQNQSSVMYDMVQMTVQRMNAAGLGAFQQPMDFATYMNRVLLDHSFDMYQCAFMIVDPGFLYDLFHSSNPEVIPSYNTAGLQDAELDAQLEIIANSPNSTAVKMAVSNAQVMLSEIVPGVPMYSAQKSSVFSPELDGIVNMYGYGTENPWTYLNLHYKGRPLGGTVNCSYHGSPLMPERLNPLYSNPNWKWGDTGDQEALDFIFDDLIRVHPETGEYMPWIATNWDMQSWTAPGNIPGMKMTLWLRNDVYWQDGTQFTAEDVRFALQYTVYFGELRDTIVDVVIPTGDPYKVEIYFNKSNYWLLEKVSRISTRFPKHIWNGKDPHTFNPDTEPHPTVPGLTQLIGTGPFCLVNKTLDYILLQANPNYFKKLPTSISQTVEPSGGRVENIAGTSSIEIPSGALAESTNVSIRQYPTSEYGGFLINQSQNIVSYGVHQFGPSGTVFQTNVSVTLTYDETLVDEEQLQSLVVYYSGDGINWTPIAVDSINTEQNTITIRVDHFSLFVIIQTPATISGTITDEYTHQPLEGVTISILEKELTTTTDLQGRYFFPDLKAGSYTVEITAPYCYLTHDSVTKFVEATGETQVNFTLYQASWSGATIPRTIGYWKNWDNHYTVELMQALIDSVKSSSGLFSDLSMQNFNSYFDITPRSTMEEKSRAQLLTSWLNVVSAQLGLDVQVDLGSILDWETVIADDGTLTVNELLRQIDSYYVTHAALTKAQWETIKNILDALNNGRLFFT